MNPYLGDGLYLKECWSMAQVLIWSLLQFTSTSAIKGGIELRILIRGPSKDLTQSFSFPPSFIAADLQDIGIGLGHSYNMSYILPLR